MKLSVVIPTHGRTRSLKRLLHSIRLASQDTPGLQDEMEIVVVTNLPGTLSREELWSESFCRLRVLESGELGVNRARNMGLAAAEGEIVLFLDDDCLVVSSKFFSQHLQLHEKNPGVVGVGGPYRLLGTKGLYSRAYDLLSRSWLEGARLAHDRTRELLGGNASYKRKRLREIHFDPKIRFGGSELSFNRDIREVLGGELLFEPGLELGHFCEVSIADFFRRAWLQGKSQARLGLQSRDRSTTSQWLQLDWPERLKIMGVERHKRLLGLAISLFQNIFSLSGELERLRLSEPSPKVRRRILLGKAWAILRRRFSPRQKWRDFLALYFAYQERADLVGHDSNRR